MMFMIGLFVMIFVLIAAPLPIKLCAIALAVSIYLIKQVGDKLAEEEQKRRNKE